MHGAMICDKFLPRGVRVADDGAVVSSVSRLVFPRADAKAVEDEDENEKEEDSSNHGSYEGALQLVRNWSYTVEGESDVVVRHAALVDGDAGVVAHIVVVDLGDGEAVVPPDPPLHGGDLPDDVPSVLRVGV